MTNLNLTNMKYYLIKSIIGQWECYWNTTTKMFGISTKATKFETEEEALKELTDTASYYESCHILEVTNNTKTDL